MSSSSPSKRSPNATTLLFIVVLSFSCALVLSSLSTFLKPIQRQARSLDLNQQMLIAAKIYSPKGYFLVEKDNGDYIKANYSGKGILEGVEDPLKATQDQILKVFNQRLTPLLINGGEKKSFDELGVNLNTYLIKHEKEGYHKQKYKLIYEIKANDSDDIAGYVIPVKGFGLWDAIYGYIALKPDGNEVIGISWYDHKETPGLGANIAESSWQKQFSGKKIFQVDPSQPIDPNTAPIGLFVIRGKVNEVIGESYQSNFSVDGMAGATLTGNGVTQAYSDVLEAYRPFLVSLYKQSGKKE